MGVGENIKRIREQKGFTQAKIAAEVGISQAMLCQIERGTKNPSLPVGMLIAKALDCEVTDLYQVAG